MSTTHAGHNVGDQVIWENPYGIDKHVGVIAALHRNGNLLIRDPEFGTTVDVHCSKVERPVDLEQAIIATYKQSLQAGSDVYDAVARTAIAFDMHWATIQMVVGA